MIIYEILGNPIKISSYTEIDDTVLTLSVHYETLNCNQT